MPDRPRIPPPAKAIFAIAIVINLVVVTGLSRAPLALIGMMLANISAFGAVYWIIIRHFDQRLP